MTPSRPRNHARSPAGVGRPAPLETRRPFGPDHDICFSTEPFCDQIAETALTAAPAAFLEAATDFANDGSGVR